MIIHLPINLPPTGERMITDMIPGHVANMIKKRHAREAHLSMSSPGCMRGEGSTGPACDVDAAIMFSSSAIGDCAVIDGGGGEGLEEDCGTRGQKCDDGRGDTPAASPRHQQASTLVYQQWHPAVSILFADIVGFTTLSKEVEPEQVMLMLHGACFRMNEISVTIIQ